MIFLSGQVMSTTPGDVNGNIVRVAVINGAAYITTNPRPSPKPSCATNTNFDFAFSINDDTGKATLNMALTAYAAKSNVIVRAAGNCTVHVNMDDVKYLILE